jgi:hypothetical protein
MGGLFGGGTPKPTPVTRMPDDEDPTVVEARRRAAQQQQARSGRSSTVLSNRQRPASGQAGTQAYGNSLLGQAR